MSNKPNQPLSHTPYVDEPLVGNNFKHIVLRVGFHFFAIALGFLIAKWAGSTSAARELYPALNQNTIENQLWLMNYLGLLLFFLPKKNRFPFIFGMLAFLTCLLTGYGSIGFLFAGFVTFITYLIRAQKMYFGSLIAAIFLMMGIISKSSFLSAIPWWYYIFLIILLLIAIFGKSYLVRSYPQIFQNPDQENKSEQVHLKNNQKTNTQNTHQLYSAPANNQTTSENNNDSLNKNYQTQQNDPYLKQLDKINQFKKSLPEDMILFIDNICEKTKSILQCMERDSRDIIIGTQFLNRYLPIIQGNLERFIRLQEHKNSFPNFEKIHEQTKTSFSDASYAFSSMHKQLLDNDVNDLVIDLNVLDKLIKLDGHSQSKD